MWGDPELAARLEGEAAQLKTAFNQAFFSERNGDGYFVLGLDR